MLAAALAAATVSGIGTGTGTGTGTRTGTGTGIGTSPLRHHRAAGGLTVRDPAGGTLLSIACTTRRRCEAVGSDETFVGPRKQLGTWTGGRWRVQVSRGSKHDIGDLLNAIACPASKTCVAVGASYRRSGVAEPLAQVLSHSRWRVVNVPVPPARGGTGSRLTGLSCLSATNCFAVGFNQTRAGAATLAEHWNGGRWRIEPTPNVGPARVSMLTRVSCASPRGCTAIGTFVTFGGEQFPFAERWNGVTWHIQATARLRSVFGFALTGISCPAIRFCVAVGGYTGQDRTLAETWYGLKWRVQPVVNPAGAVTSSLADVSCRSARNCVSVGFFRPNYHLYRTLIEAWNGHRWVIQASPSRSRVSSLFSVSCPGPRTCLAVGDYSRLLGLRRTLVLTWNGRGWRLAP